VTVGWVLRGQAQKGLLRLRLELLYGKEFDPTVPEGDRRMDYLETGKNKLGEYSMPALKAASGNIWVVYSWWQGIRSYEGESMRPNQFHIVYGQRKLSNNKKLTYSIILLII